jgi:hypothetical protein
MAPPHDLLSTRHWFPFLRPCGAHEIVAAPVAQRELGIAIAIMRRHRRVAEQAAAQRAHQ